MEIFKLISMVDFVLEQRKDPNCGDFTDLCDLYCRYAKFLKQPLEPWMFVPCDVEGNVLEEPINNPNQIEPQPMLGQKEYDQIVLEWETYQQAKERCLFEGFELIHKHDKHYKQALIAKNKEGVGQFDIYDYKTIEDLIHMNLTLTPTAIKQIRL